MKSFSGCIIVLVREIWQALSQMWTVNLATMKKAWTQGQNPKYGTEPGLRDTCSEYTSLNVFVIRGLSLISGGQEFMMISCFCSMRSWAMSVCVLFTVRCEILSNCLVHLVCSHTDAIHWLNVMKLLVNVVLRCLGGKKGLQWSSVKASKLLLIRITSLLHHFLVILLSLSKMPIIIWTTWILLSDWLINNNYY